jgi:hypothetical protein
VASLIDKKKIFIIQHGALPRLSNMLFNTLALFIYCNFVVPCWHSYPFVFSRSSFIVFDFFKHVFVIDQV